MVYSKAYMDVRHTNDIIYTGCPWLLNLKARSNILKMIMTFVKEYTEQNLLSVKPFTLVSCFASCSILINRILDRIFGGLHLFQYPLHLYSSSNSICQSPFQLILTKCVPNRSSVIP